MSMSPLAKRLIKAPFRALGLDLCVKRPYPLEFLRSYGVGTALDIGAHDGQFSAELRAVLPKAMIHAFEPLREPFEQMQRLHKRDKLFKAWNIAVGEDTGTNQIEVNKMTASTSFLPLGEIRDFFPGATVARKEAIQVVALDEWSSGLHLKPGILLKADVQGYEGHVLRGAKRTIQQVEVAILEVSFVRLYKDQELFDDINIQMREYGFHLSGMFHPVRDPKTNRQLQSNAIYCRNH